MATPSIYPTDQKRVLVVYKKSAFQSYVNERKNVDIKRLLRQKDKTVERLVAAHQAHEETLRETRRELESLGALSLFRYRGDQTMVRGVDLVVTVGGDGTLLWAARFCGPSVPILPINSSPVDSVGHYCAFKKGAVGVALRKAFAGELKATVCQRMEVRLDDEVVSKRILNDVLFCHASPGATSRYLLQPPHRKSSRTSVEEEQKSSGVWIGPPAGSTAAQRSAGGKIMPLTATRLQYIVREPYVGPAGPYKAIQGVFGADQRLVVTSKMRDARIFLDGHRHIREVKMGQRLAFCLSDEPVTILGYVRTRL